jgi:hypothetical protein
VSSSHARLILALARPRAWPPASPAPTLDIVVLQDGSASMSVRVCRAVRGALDQFLRTLGDALRWDGDRVAMTVFAHMARRDPAHARSDDDLFFLDHLSIGSPLPLTDDMAGQREGGIAWGLRVLRRIAKSRSSQNAPVFLLISDGEAGRVARGGPSRRHPALRGRRGHDRRRSHALMPLPVEGDPRRSFHISIAGVAAPRDEGRGYFELDQELDRDIANTVIRTARRSAPANGRTRVHGTPLARCRGRVRRAAVGRYSRAGGQSVAGTAGRRCRAARALNVLY